MEDVLATTYVALFVYGLSVIISEYDGPFRLFYKMRASRLGVLFKCSTCMVPYIATVAVLCMDMSLLQFMAIFGVNIMLTRNL